MADEQRTATIPSSDLKAQAQQPLNRHRALRVLGALAAAAAGAAALNAARPPDADAYQVTNAPSTDFGGPIRATGGTTTLPDGAAVIGDNPSPSSSFPYGGVGVSGSSKLVGVYGSASGSVPTIPGAIGVLGTSEYIGVLGSGPVTGLHGIGGIIGVVGQGEFGVEGVGTTAVYGDGSKIGLRVTMAATTAAASAFTAFRPAAVLAYVVTVVARRTTAPAFGGKTTPAAQPSWDSHPVASASAPSR